MGNCVSSQDREAQQRSQEIDKQIEEDSRKFKKECKILLLGEYSSIHSPQATGGSGGLRDPQDADRGGEEASAIVACNGPREGTLSKA